MGRDSKRLDIRPFHLRYPTTINILVFADAPETESALRNLIDTVRKGMDAL
jgi:hypothetical protein